MDSRTELDLEVERRLNKLEERAAGPTSGTVEAFLDSHNDRLTALEELAPARAKVAAFDAIAARVSDIESEHPGFFKRLSDLEAERGLQGDHATLQGILDDFAALRSRQRDLIAVLQQMYPAETIIGQRLAALAK